MSKTWHSASPIHALPCISVSVDASVKGAGCIDRRGAQSSPHLAVPQADGRIAPSDTPSIALPKQKGMGPAMASTSSVSLSIEPMPPGYQSHSRLRLMP
jgi:hypothetical protein